MTAIVAILWAVAAVLLSAVGLVLLVLALPLHLRVSGAVRDGEPSGVVRAAWAFGLLAGELTPGGLAVRVAGLRVYRARLLDLFRKRRSRRKQKEREGRIAPEELGDRGERTAREERGRSKLDAFLEHRGALFRILRRLGGTLHLRLRIRGVVGLDDPADTIRLEKALAALGELPGVDMAVELDWLEETLEGEVVGTARVWVPETVAVAVALLLERRNRAAVRALAS